MPLKNDFIAFSLLIASALSVSAASSQPNILLIMSDDMGFSDIGCYGGEIATPNLDRLAANGLRFAQFYNTGRCCPTRAALLTGLYPHQAGVGHMMEDLGLPPYQGHLNQQCLTIAEVLKSAGYRTYMAGKWHVTPYQPNKEAPDRTHWPLQRGFDRFYGTIHGAGSFFDPSSLTRDNQYISPAADPEYTPEVYYYTDAIADHVVRYLREHQDDHGEKPFFTYAAFTAAHWPMHALPEDIAKYKGRYDQGYAPIRAARLQRLRDLGLLPDGWRPAPQVGAWEKVEDKAWESACMEVYAAMVDRLDQGIGRIIDELERSNQLDNTLILFLQDNGGCAEAFGRQEMLGPRERPSGPTLPAMAPTALQKDMVPQQSRDGFPLRRGQGAMPGPPETQIGYGRNWANVSNTPFREYKHWVHEGGIAPPLIAHWPKGIVGKNRWDSTPSHLIDIMATALDVSGAVYPSKGKTALEGMSLKPLFTQEAVHRGKPLFWEHEGNRAVRDGKWKLVAKGVNGDWELYDMEADRTETHDLASAQPELAHTMAEQYDLWAKERGVVPFGSWKKAQ